MNPAPLTLFEHLGELRKRLLISFGAVAVSMVAGFLCSDQVLRVLIAPIRPEISQVYFFSPVEAFSIKLKIAFLVGLLIASPVVISQVWLFVSPGLYEKERKLVLPLIFVTSFLFLAGALFSFFCVAPLALKFLVGMQTEFLKPMISMAEYISFLSMMILAFGAAFNLPVFIMAFAFLGLLDTGFLGRYRKHAVILIFIAAAVLTPGADVASQLLLAVPLLVLFEAGVAGARLVEVFRKRRGLSPRKT